MVVAFFEEARPSLEGQAGSSHEHHRRAAYQIDLRR
jgi:hypothetical protein